MSDNQAHGVIFMLLLIAGILFLIWLKMPEANAQTVRDTVLSFISAEDLNRQLIEIEGCDTVIINTWDREDRFDSLPDSITILDWGDSLAFAVITCREVAWVAVIYQPWNGEWKVPGTTAVGVREKKPCDR